MATTARTAAFTQADIRRAMKCMESAGKTVAAVDFPKEGGFRLILGEPMEVAQSGIGANEWDDVLTRAA